RAPVRAAADDLHRPADRPDRDPHVHADLRTGLEHSLNASCTLQTTRWSSVIEAVDGPPPLVVVAPVIARGGLDVGVMRQLLGDRQVVLLDDPGDEGAAEIVRHDLHPYL